LQKRCGEFADRMDFQRPKSILSLVNAALLQKEPGTQKGYPKDTGRRSDFQIVAKIHEVTPLVS